MKPKTSELSRGIWIIGIFALFGFFQIIAADGFNMAANLTMGILCLLIISHGFATMNVIRALPVWSSTMVLPLVFTLIMWGGDTNGFLIFLRLASVCAGDLAIRYLIMKSAVYKPLI